VKQVGCSPRYWTSPALSEALRLTEAERVALGGVPTIGAVDVTTEQRKEMRKARNKERKRRKRRAAGMRPQSESISRAKPWEKEGISRAKWYRQRRETTLGAVNLETTAAKPVSTSEASRTAPPQRAEVHSAIPPRLTRCALTYHGVF
jgi:hypothetical protein